MKPIIHYKYQLTVPAFYFRTDTNSYTEAVDTTYYGFDKTSAEERYRYHYEKALELKAKGEDMRFFLDNLVLQVKAVIEWQSDWEKYEGQDSE